jgi:hypothetical protein
MSSLLVFNRVYRREIQSVMLVFSTGFVNYCPSTFCLIRSPPPCLPCVNKYTVYTYTVCKGGGEYGIIGVEGASDRSTPVAKSLYWSIFLDNYFWYFFYQSNLSTVCSFHSIHRLSLVTIYCPSLPVPFHTDVFYVLL